jgi:hypothetical protein
MRGVVATCPSREAHAALSVTTAVAEFQPSHPTDPGRALLDRRAGASSRGHLALESRPLGQSRSRGWSCPSRCNAAVSRVRRLGLERCGRQPRLPGVRARRPELPVVGAMNGDLAHPTSHRALHPATTDVELPMLECWSRAGRPAPGGCFAWLHELMVGSPLLGVRSLRTYDFSGAGRAPSSMPA